MAASKVEAARYLARSLERLIETRKASEANRERYRRDPVAYVRERHNARPWWRQRQVLRALVRPPYRVMARSGNGTGKTWLAGAYADFRYENYNPGLVLLTGPKFDQVKDTTFKEIRRFRRGDPNVYAKNPIVEENFEHWIHGTTASDPTAFQGHHDQAVAVVFEEAVGIYPDLWEVVRGIIVGGDTAWMAILNPTDRDCQAYVEESAVGPDGEPQWTVIQISQLEHPNILSEVAGCPPPIPGAIELTALRSNLTSDAHWGMWVAESDYKAETDVDLWDGSWYGLPPGPVTQEALDELVEEEGEVMTRREFLGLAAGVTAAAIAEGLQRFFPKRYWRPGPIGDARILGRYPRQPAYAVFHEGMFELAAKAVLEVDLHARPAMGCDVARFGDDMTVVHAQRGGICLEHEARAHSDTRQTAEWLKERCHHWAKVYDCKPTEIPVRIDDTGVGGGVVDNAGEYLFIPVVAQRRAMRDDKYPDARSEMLFSLAERMSDGKLATSRLPDVVRHEVRRQAEKVMWKQDTQGRRRVFPKAVVKDALGRSPDDLDAMALAHYPLGGTPGPAASAGDSKSPPVHKREFRSGTERLFR